jgi:hypothetical protein
MQFSTHIPFTLGNDDLEIAPSMNRYQNVWPHYQAHRVSLWLAPLYAISGKKNTHRLILQVGYQPDVVTDWPMSG